MEKNARIQRVLLLGSALLLAILYQNREQGLNYLIVSVAVGVLSLYQNLGTQKSKLVYLILVGMVVSGLGVYLSGQTYSILVWWLNLILLGSVTAYPNFKNASLVVKTISTQTPRLFGGLAMTLGNKDQSKAGRLKSWFRYFGVPAITLILLISIYANANTYFAKSLEASWLTIKNLFGDISFQIFFWFGAGLVFMSYFFIQENSKTLEEEDEKLQLELIREKKRSPFRFLNKRLLRKMQVSIAFFSVINLMLFWQHVTEIQNVWFGFEFTGQLLKGFVHDGTWLLIYALIISIGITWYYLDSNLVFMKKSTLFNALIVVWLLQNLLLVITVAVRTSFYIEYYALAYKRILVLFFLGFTAIALLSLIYKVLARKSLSYISNNLVGAAVLILPVSGCLNWDVEIAKYNFAHAEKAYLDYEFLKDMNNEAFAYMENRQEELNRIDSIQALRFPVKIDSKESEFAETVSEKQALLKAKGEQLDIWEQNLSTLQALRNLENEN
ncbi:MAG: DUF4173 domain-containing protein [Bacteroidia bacterium]|nr:DUF4173 domain-containing protein [Bacteroidia bacterium]